MGRRYAEVSDISAFGQQLTTAQIGGAEALIEAASSKLRIIAYKYGVVLDDLIADPVTGEDYANVLKNVIIQSVIRAFDSMEKLSPTFTQGTQAAMGYSVTMTYLNAGQSLYFLKNELKDLGIIRQKYGAMEVYTNENDD